MPPTSFHPTENLLLGVVIDGDRVTAGTWRFDLENPPHLSDESYLNATDHSAAADYSPNATIAWRTHDEEANQTIAEVFGGPVYETFSGADPSVLSTSIRWSRSGSDVAFEILDSVHLYGANGANFRSFSFPENVSGDFCTTDWPDSNIIWVSVLNFRIFELDLLTGQYQELHDSTWYARKSPNGRLTVRMSSDSPSYGVFLDRHDSSGEQELLAGENFGLRVQSYLPWTRDGRWLCFYGEVLDTASEHPFQIIFQNPAPVIESGTVQTPFFTFSPLHGYEKVVAEIDTAGGSISLEYSVDGSNWNSVPADGDLTSVDTSTGEIAFKAILSRTDSAVTPVIRSLKLFYGSQFRGFRSVPQVRTARPQTDRSSASEMTTVVKTGTPQARWLDRRMLRQRSAPAGTSHIENSRPIEVWVFDDERRVIPFRDAQPRVHVRFTENDTELRRLAAQGRLGLSWGDTYCRLTRDGNGVTFDPEAIGPLYFVRIEDSSAVGVKPIRTILWWNESRSDWRDSGVGLVDSSIMQVFSADELEAALLLAGPSAHVIVIGTREGISEELMRKIGRLDGPYVFDHQIVPPEATVRYLKLDQ